MAESRERDGLFGKYKEQFDDDGNKIGESREHKGVFGNYTEHTDIDGNKIGESREREGFWGDYTEHTDTDGNKIGESRERDGFLGDYTEHTDTDGNKIGESREHDGILGKYTRHSHSGLPVYSQNSTDNTESFNSSTDDDYSYNTEDRPKESKRKTKDRKSYSYDFYFTIAKLFRLFRLSKLEKFVFQMGSSVARKNNDYYVAARMAEKSGSVVDAIKYYIWDGSYNALFEAQEVATKNNIRKEAIELFERYNYLLDAAKLAECLGENDRAIELYKRAGLCSEKEHNRILGYEKACSLAEIHGKTKLALEIAKEAKRFYPQSYTSGYVIFERLIKRLKEKLE